MNAKNYSLILILVFVAIAIAVLPSCAARKKRASVTVPQMQPPPPPPPPSGEVPFVVVEEMPMFPGGDSALLAYIAKNTTYPEEAKKNGVQGRVIVRFCVTEEGKVSLVTVLKGVSPELDKEAIRVVSSLPSFYPGKQGGKPVPVWYMVPITFGLAPKVKSPADSTSYNTPILIQSDNNSDEPYVAVEEMPAFPGGDAALVAYIATNVVYPAEAKKNGTQGRVIARFCVTKTGSIDKVSVLRGVSPELDAEAIRVVKTLPAFTPGRQGGKPVNVWYLVPIEFALK